MSAIPRIGYDTNLVFDQNSAIDEAFRGDYLGGMNIIYKGFARPGAATAQPIWQIAKITYDVNNNVTAIQWPAQINGVPNANGSGSNDYLFIWDNRTTYTYL